MGNDSAYIYGEHNGHSYTSVEGEGNMKPGESRTHYDPRVEVKGFGGMSVQIGVVPPTFNTDSDDPNWDPESVQWDPEFGQFLSLDWAGCNRLIVAVREQRDRVFGKAE